MLEQDHKGQQTFTPAQLAGQKGGLATARSHGHEFYRQIGSKSGGRFIPGGTRAKDQTQERQEELMPIPM